MGKALSNLFSSEKERHVNIFIDFEKATPSGDNEQKVYQEVDKYLELSGALLTEVANFKGCDSAIKAAISTPSVETDDACWKLLLPSVDVLKRFYDFSEDLAQLTPNLLKNLFNGDQNQNLTTQQALAKQLAKVLDFVLRFDDCKMKNSSIQNDFSYYRRSLNKGTRKNEAKVKDDLANKMSLFFAYPTPMLRVIIEATTTLVKSGAIQKVDVINGFTLLSNVCLEMVQLQKFENEETNLFCLRAMTAGIVIVDHLDELGAFHKGSRLHIKNAIGALQNYNPKTNTDSLLNAIKFSTINLNKPETPQIIRGLLGV